MRWLEGSLEERRISTETYVLRSAFSAAGFVDNSNMAVPRVSPVRILADSAFVRSLAQATNEHPTLHWSVTFHRQSGEFFEVGSCFFHLSPLFLDNRVLSRPEFAEGSSKEINVPGWTQAFAWAAEADHRSSSWLSPERKGAAYKYATLRDNVAIVWSDVCQTARISTHSNTRPLSPLPC